MTQDIRNLGKPLRNWENSPTSPGWMYCFCTTGSGQKHRIHIAKKTDFKVLGSFPSFTTATATMRQLYQLEAAAA